MAKALLGGLLAGAGRGMVDQAEQRRQEALERARELRRQMEREEDRSWRKEDQQEERNWQGERDELQHSRAMEREEASDTRRRGLLSTTSIGEDGYLYGITGGVEAINTGVRPAAAAGRSGSGSGDDLSGFGMSAEEKRIYDEIKSGYTDSFGNFANDEKKQDFISHLRRQSADRGGERFNEIADYLTGSIGTNMTEEEARTRAAREAQGRMSIFRPRSSEFPETGGDVEAWTQNRIRELIGGGSASSSSQQSGQQSGSQFNSAEDVRAAFQAGRIPREEALRILRDQFGYQ